MEAWDLNSVCMCILYIRFSLFKARILMSLVKMVAYQSLTVSPRLSWFKLSFTHLTYLVPGGISVYSPD